MIKVHNPFNGRQVGEVGEAVLRERGVLAAAVRADLANKALCC